METNGTRDMARIATPVFDDMCWTWRGEPNPPNITEIELAIDSLVDMVTDGNLTSAESGRIKVERREESSYDDHTLDVWLHLGSL